jgi:hypothetical protein
MEPWLLLDMLRLLLAAAGAIDYMLGAEDPCAALLVVFAEKVGFVLSVTKPLDSVGTPVWHGVRANKKGDLCAKPRQTWVDRKF